MENPKLVVSHAPFWHDGGSIGQRSRHAMLAALPAALVGVFQYGMPAVGVICLAISTAMLWELAVNRITGRAPSIGDGTAALTGLLMAMMLPATTPWWVVVTGTFLAIVVAKQIYGGIGANPFNPVAIAIAILLAAWKNILDVDGALLNYELGFDMRYPLQALKAFGPDAVASFSMTDLLIGHQTGGIGTTCGVALIAGGLYLMARGFIRWEIALSFLAGLFLTAFAFNLAAPARFAGPGLHLLAGASLFGAFFLAPEDSSSPVNFIPMLIYGACGGLLTVLIRNIGSWVDGVVFAVLVINLINPLLDMIRPKVIGKAA